MNNDKVKLFKQVGITFSVVSRVLLLEHCVPRLAVGFESKMIGWGKICIDSVSSKLLLRNNFRKFRQQVKQSPFKLRNFMPVVRCPTLSTKISKVFMKSAKILWNFALFRLAKFASVFFAKMLASPRRTHAFARITLTTMSMSFATRFKRMLSIGRNTPWALTRWFVPMVTAPYTFALGHGSIITHESRSLEGTIFPVSGPDEIKMFRGTFHALLPTTEEVQNWVVEKIEA